LAPETTTLQHRSQEDRTVISKTTTSGVRIKSRVKASGMPRNHSQAANGMRVKSRIKAGGLDTTNHNQTARGIRIKSRVKAGFVMRQNSASPTLMNHSQTAKGLRVKSSVKAGLSLNYAAIKH
jgi:hypothetical protein